MRGKVLSPVYTVWLARLATCIIASAINGDMSDPSCSSNYDDVVVTHLDWQVETDFSAKELHCAATLKARTQKEGVAKLVCTATWCG